MFRTRWFRGLIVTGACFVGLGPVVASASTPAEVADALHQALKSGDPAMVRALMVDNVQIFESGKLEASFEEYAAHHLQSDMAFIENLDRSITSRHVEESEGLAVVTTLSMNSGTYQGRSKRLRMTETVVLKQSDGEWKIHVVHWSAR